VKAPSSKIIVRAVTICALSGLALVSAVKLAPRVFARSDREHKRILIREPIEEGKRIRLRGNTRPEANERNDRGRVDDDRPMEHMLLQLKRPPELEQQFDQYIESLTDKTSPNFRQWITAAEQGEKYGPAQQDIDTVINWLQSHGFTVNYVYPNRMVFDFSGTAGDIRRAFHTEIHHLEVHGEPHIANMSDPEIPAALAPAIVGVVSMHDFKPQHMLVPVVHTDYTFSGCSGGTNSTGGHCYPLVPADLQTIYNLNPLYREGIDGTGQTITLVEDSNTFSTDAVTYRSTFLSKWSGTMTTTHPAGAAPCTNPGTNADDGEADLDAEVAAAIAPNATIVMATCADTTTNGVLLAVENLVNSASPPSIISQSYGECEAFNGATSNAAFNTAFQTGAAAGVSIFVSSGDSGASGCAPLFGASGSTQALSGIGISGWGETIYNVSVGGTDFEDAYNAKATSVPISTYWGATNTTTFGSAISYIPEIPWNDSCSGYLLYNYEAKATGYGSTGECASAFHSTAAGSGGPSACATGGGGTDQTTRALVDGSCAGYAKPSWQSGIAGNPADGVRDIPDVSLFASNGIWGHYIVVCYADTANGGTSCAGAPSTWSGFGGTSASAPMMAAIQALVNEKWSIAKAGNPNPTYYAIAKTEFGSGGNSSCYSINQPPRFGLASSCVFYDVTQGDNDVDCQFNGTTSMNCYRPSGTYGSLSTQALNTPGTVIAGGSGYTSTPTCTLGAPSNADTYQSPTGTTLWAGGTQATCTATRTGSAITAITISNGGQGYAGGTSCTLTGGGGTGATCSASPTRTSAPASWQPAYGTTPGWDFATGIGSVNAYNLVYNSAW